MSTVEPKSEPVRRVLVVRWGILAITLVSFLLVSFGVYLRYHSQLDRSTNALLERAEGLEKEGKWQEAASRLFDYVQLRPEASEQRFHLAKLYADHAKTYRERSRAIELQSMALGALENRDENQPHRQELAISLANLQLQQGEFASARNSAQGEIGTQIVSGLEDSAKAKRIRALASFWEHLRSNLKPEDFPSSLANELVLAVKANPSDVDLVAASIELIRYQPGLVERFGVSPTILLDACVQAAEAQKSSEPDQYVRALLARSEYLLNSQQGTHPTARENAKWVELAEEDLQRLLAIADHDQLKVSPVVKYEILLRAADRAIRQSNYGEAEASLRQAIEISPGLAPAYSALGRLKMTQGDLRGAKSVWTDSLSKINQIGSTIEIRLALIGLLIDTLPPTRKSTEILDHGFVELQKAVADLLASLPYNTPQRVTHNLLNRVKLLEGRYDVRNGSSDCLLKLKQVVEASLDGGGEPATNAVAKEAIYQLGRAYVGLGNSQEAAQTYELLETIEPSTQTFVICGDAWITLNPEKALRFYQRAISSNRQQPTLPMDILLAKSLTAEWRLSSNKPERSPSFQEVLASARNEFPNSWRLKLLEWQYQKVDRLEILKRLESISNSQAPPSAELLAALTLEYQATERPADADRTLQRLKALPSSAELVRQLELQLSSLRQGPVETSRSDDDDVDQKLYQEALTDIRERNYEAAAKKLEQLHEPQVGKSLPIARMLAEIRLYQQDWKRLESLELEMKKIEGDNGTWWKIYRVQRRMRQDREPNQPVKYLDEANKLLSEVEQRQLDSSNPVVNQLRGDIEVAKSDLIKNDVEKRATVQKAMEAYKRSWEGGNRQLETANKLVMTLFSLNQFEEAERIIQTMSDQSRAASQVLTSASIAIALQDQDLNEATKRAAAAIEVRPQDPSGYLWLSSIQQAQQKLGEAEATLREAVKRIPQSPQLWGSLFTLLAQVSPGGGESSAAFQLLSEVQKTTGLPSTTKASFLAHAYARLGRMDLAESFADQMDPEIVVDRISYAQLALRQDLPKAETRLRSILADNPEEESAQRLLAVILSLRGGDDAWEEVQQLVGGKEFASASGITDQRLMAVLLARSTDPSHRPRAKALLESLVSQPQATVGDRLLLAAIYSEESSPDKAREQFEAIKRQENIPPDFFVHYVRFLLQVNDFDGASEELRHLEGLAASDDRIRVAYLPLKALWMTRSGQSQLVDGWLKEELKKLSPSETSGPKYIQYLNIGAQVWTSLGQDPDAEKWFRDLFRVEPKTYPLLVGNLVRQRRTQEAIDVCLAQPDTSSPSFVNTLVSVLLSGTNPAALESDQVKRLLNHALQKHESNPQVAFDVGNLRAASGSSQEAVRLLQVANRQKPGDVRILNNLATVLGEIRGQEKEALRYIDEAIKIMGKEAGPLLDTKGTIQMLVDPAQAVVTLKQATASERPDPRALLHLAQAYELSKDLAQAKVAFKKAIEAGVERSVLTQSDRDALKKLRGI